jgi:hypothetical protein
MIQRRAVHAPPGGDKTRPPPSNRAPGAKPLAGSRQRRAQAHARQRRAQVPARQRRAQALRNRRAAARTGA